jgi:hypothetical protein
VLEHAVHKLEQERLSFCRQMRLSDVALQDGSRRVLYRIYFVKSLQGCNACLPSNPQWSSSREVTGTSI